MLKRIPTHVILFTAFVLSTSPVFSDSCGIDPQECTPKNLCEMTTETQGGQKVWTSKTEMSKHISFAKQLGMDCGATDPKDPCDLDANECKISELCDRATTAEDNKQWNLDNPDHVRLAKDYSLTCDVTQDSSAKISSCNLGAEQLCTDEQICTKATSDGDWVSFKTYQPFVIEAKKRGLVCGVGEQNTNSISCKDIESLKICSAEELCQMATTVKNGSTVWANKYSVYRTWAKERGLNCGVKTIEPVVQSTTCIASKPEGCGTTQLCQLATTKRSGVLTWTSPNSSFKKEAVKRGLTCNVSDLNLEEYRKYLSTKPEFKGDVQIYRFPRVNNKNRFYSKPNGRADFWLKYDWDKDYKINLTTNTVFPNLRQQFNALKQDQERKSKTIFSPKVTTAVMWMVCGDEILL